MKEFWIYTVLRLGLLVGTGAIIAGAWQLTSGSINYFWVVVLAFLISGIASYTVLNRQRNAFALRVETRAARSVQAFEDRRAREDVEES